MGGNIDFFAKPHPQHGRYPWTNFSDPDPRPIYKTLAILRDWDMTLTHLHALALRDELKGNEELWDSINSLCEKLTSIFKGIANQIKDLDGEDLENALDDFLKALEKTLTAIYTAIISLTDHLADALNDLTDHVIKHDATIQAIIEYIESLADLINATYNIEENYTKMDVAINCNTGYATQKFWENSLGNGVQVTYYDQSTTYNGKIWHNLKMRIRSTASNGICTAESTSGMGNKWTWWSSSECNEDNCPNFRHTKTRSSIPTSVVFSVVLPDEWKDKLTSENLRSTTQYGNMIWNARPTSHRASWDVHCDTDIEDGEIYITMVSISDGFNSQYYNAYEWTASEGFYITSANIQLELNFTFFEEST